MTEPLVPNPNIRPPDLKPRSADDYTPTEGTPVKGQTHPAIKYTFIDDEGQEVEDKYKTLANKIATGTLGITRDIEDASDISLQFGQGRLDNDVTEDKLRHILLGGLTAKRRKGDPLRKSLLAPLAKYGMDEFREGNDPESNIDKINNQFGRYLREEYPNEKEFIDQAIKAVINTAEGQDYVGKDGKVSAIQPINSIQRQYQDYVMSDEFNELPYNSRYTQLMSMGVDPRDVARIIDEPAISDEERREMQPPTREQLQSGMYKGGALMAQQGVVPMTKAQEAPTGKGPKTAQGRKQTKKPKVQRGLARPMTDPRDIAMQEIQQASQQKGTQMPMAQAAKGVTAITVGIGSKPDLMKAEKGEPPMGATKKEVADDQHVMMSEGELVVPANVVRYHGLGTYENMRQEALAGLEMMEEAGQIEYVGDEKTSKTNDGGLLKAQAGVTPLGTAPTAASAQFAGLGTSDASKFGYTPLRLNTGIPIYDAEGNITGYQQNTQPTPTRTTGIGAIFTGDPTSVVAPNVGDYQKSVEEDFTKPPEGTGGTTTSAGVGGDTGGGGGFAPATPNLTPQQQMEQFDTMMGQTQRQPSATAFSAEKEADTGISDFQQYINRRTPGDQGTGIMGKAADMVDTAAGFILPGAGYQDKLIRRNAARKLVAGNYNNKDEYDTLTKVVDLPPLSGEGSDDDTTKQLITQAKEEMKTGFDDAKSAKAAAFQEETVRFKELQEEERKATPLFKKTPVDSFLTGKTDDTDKAAADRIEQNRASVQREAMNPIRAAERMRTELGGGDTSMMSGAEREEAQRKQEDAARRAADFEAFRQREEDRRAEDRLKEEQRQRGETVSERRERSEPTAFEPGGAFGGSDDKIVCTEMYRQTQLVDWQKAMKVWDIYQRRHLTPEHQVGYHWLFRPYVTGMQSSNILTRLGAFMARKRTQHLKHILTKGKAKDDLFGNVFCKLIHPTVYIAGKIKTFLTKI